MTARRTAASVCSGNRSVMCALFTSGRVWESVVFDSISFMVSSCFNIIITLKMGLAKYGEHCQGWILHFSSEKENWIICPFDRTCAVQSSCCCCVSVRDTTVWEFPEPEPELGSLFSDSISDPVSRVAFLGHGAALLEGRVYVVRHTHLVATRARRYSIFIIMSWFQF